MIPGSFAVSVNCSISSASDDGFRILAQRDSAGVRLFTRAGNDFSHRFPVIATAVGKHPVRSCLIDGEAIVCDENGLAVFDLIRGYGSKTSALLCAFDLLELDGEDLRRKPIERRKALLARLLKEHSSLSMSITRGTVRLCFARLVGSVVRALCRNGLARFIVVVAHRFGSRSKTRMRQR